MTKTTGSLLSADVGGRIYLDYAPDYAEYPSVVFFIVAGNPDRTFTERYTDTLIQFSLFSASGGAAEITTMHTHLKALFDECTLTITGSVLVWMKEESLTTMVDDVVTVGAATQVRHWACDYTIKTSLN